MRELGRTLPFVVGLYLVIWGLSKLLKLSAPHLAKVHPAFGQAAAAASDF
jgi:hypothetical protein